MKYVAFAPIIAMLVVCVVRIVNIAWAQTSTGANVTISWQAVTKDDKGNPLPAGSAVTYNVYGSHSASGPWTLAINTSALLTVRQNVEIGTDCYTMAATFNGVESVRETPICLTITGPLPVVITPAAPAGFVAVQTQ